MKTIFFFMLSAIAISSCAKKSDVIDNPQPTGVYINPAAKYIALGDSYTIGQSIPLDQSFPYQLTRALGQNNTDPTIIAATGWTSANLITAIDQSGVTGNKYDIVTMLIGVNDQFQGISTSTYSTNFTSLLNTAIKLAGNNASHVFVLSIPDYSVTPFAVNANKEAIATQIDTFNNINKQITQSAGVNYINITDISRMAKTQPDLLANDGLHPSAKMYGLWVQKLAPLVQAASAR